MIERITSNFRRVKALAPQWDMIISDKVYYLMVVEDGKDMGVMVFHTCNEPGLLMHVELGHDCRGAKAAAAYKAAFRWIFDNTDYETLHGRIPDTTRHARVMARHVGADFIGVDCDGLVCYNITKHYERRIA
jgi:hypothetical protein